MNEPTLEARVERLERQNGRLKLGMLAVVAVVGALVCVAATERVPKVVKAQRFEVVDSIGKVRAYLGLDAEECSNLTLTDKDGRIVRAILNVPANGCSVLTLTDQRGSERVTLATGPDGSPGLALHGKDGIPRGYLGVFANESSSLALSGKDLNTRASLHVSANGRPELTLKDKDGKVLWKAP